MFSHAAPFQDAAVAASALAFVIKTSKRSDLGARASQAQSFLNTPIIIYLYPAKSLILQGNGALANLLDNCLPRTLRIPRPSVNKRCIDLLESGRA
jgi:hypothetical protein